MSKSKKAQKQIAAIQEKYDLPEERAARVYELEEKGASSLSPAEFYEWAINVLPRRELARNEKVTKPKIKPNWKLKSTASENSAPVALNDLVRAQYGNMTSDEITEFFQQAQEDGAPVVVDDFVWMYHRDDVEIDGDGRITVNMQTADGTTKAPEKKARKKKTRVTADDLMG